MSYHADGQQTITQRYYPWGTIRSGPDNALPTDHTFTGQRLDNSTGLYYYGARYYDPALGRFVQADTIVPEPGNPQALNRYSYVYNNPLRYTDPSGHDAWDPGAGGAPIGAYKKAFGIYGYPTPDELYEAFEAGYNPFFDPDNFLISEDGTVLVRGAGNDVYFQEYYHWAFDTGDWLPLPQDLRHDVFAYWTVVQAGISVLKPTHWKDIAVQGVGPSAVLAGGMIGDWLRGAGGGSGSAVGVHGNRLDSPKPTWLYKLVDRDTGQVMKYGHHERNESTVAVYATMVQAEQCRPHTNCARAEVACVPT